MKAVLDSNLHLQVKEQRLKDILVGKEWGGVENIIYSKGVACIGNNKEIVVSSILLSALIQKKKKCTANI